MVVIFALADVARLVLFPKSHGDGNLDGVIVGVEHEGLALTQLVLVDDELVKAVVRALEIVGAASAVLNAVELGEVPGLDRILGKNYEIKVERVVANA